MSEQKVLGTDLRVGDVVARQKLTAAKVLPTGWVEVVLDGVAVHWWPADGLYTIQRPEPPVRRWRRTQRWEYRNRDTSVIVRETSDPKTAVAWRRDQERPGGSLVRDDIEETTDGSDR